MFLADVMGKINHINHIPRSGCQDFLPVQTFSAFPFPPFPLCTLLHDVECRCPWGVVEHVLVVVVEVVRGS